MEAKVELTNTFWSEDYITGIDCLLRVIQSDIAELSRFADLYDRHNENWLYAIKQLNTLTLSLSTSNDGSLRNKSSEKGTDLASMVYRNHLYLLERLTDKLRGSTLSEVEDPIKNLLFSYKEFQSDVEDSLKADHTKFRKQIDNIRYLHSQIKNKALSILDSNANDDAASLSEATDSERSLPPSIRKLLNFESEREWYEFLIELKKEVPVSKRKWAIPALPNEYFSSEALFETLKRQHPKMDSSLYNLEQIGQNLMDLGVLRSYNDVLHRPGSKFASQGYYCWVMDMAPPAGKLLQGIWKRVSSSSSINNEDNSYTALELSQLNDQFVKQWLILESHRLKLELDLSHFMKQYAKLSKNKFKTIKEVDFNMIEMFNKNWDIQGKLCEEDFENLWYESYTNNHGTIGFYTPPGLRFEMYNMQGVLASQPWIFGTPLNEMSLCTEDKPIILEKLLTMARQFDPDTVAKEWAAPLDLVNICNMKKDCLNEYLHNCDHDIVMNKFGSKWADCANIIQLLRAWLLELPDSIIPVIRYHNLRNNDHDWLNNSPAVHLLSLAAIASHFRWLGKDNLDALFDTNPTSRFPNVQEFPISHHFIRSRVREPLHCSIFNEILHNCFLDPEFPAKCAGAVTATSSPRSGRPRTHLLTVTTDVHEFVPRPFKTSSCEPSPTRAKRLTGLTILPHTNPN
ncbi:Rgd3p Ecym_5107 [Eremothecium cymbalariae DBVPG|uniref:Rho-GAP domain-containing protein n=1 Tax=Eremothecium cymbalariae (strain CBS 270.75 / DBVPG 7215 / KCTC 17166 / NRRL Y-17582) TaxID=931890 RepID=I6NCU7_ERECY|nr:hypothetical protein Ecym_5107 [Eremothecium cymbalariae DBVPG\